MSSVVLDLQELAYNSDVSISTLLRKAYVIAKKLKVKDFEEWIDNELSGYKKEKDIPKYREVAGDIRGWNPFYGWVPVICDDTKWAELLTSRKIAQPVTSMESVVKNSKDSTLIIPFPKEFEAKILKYIQPKTQISLFIDKSRAEGIIESVRNIVLKWALKLEEDGILGEGISFSDEEKETASQVTYKINNYFDSVSNTQIQQGTVGSTQISTQYNINELKELVNLISNEVKKVDLGGKKSEFDSEITTIKTQADSPNPKPGIIRESLISIRNILEGTTGSVIAYGLIYKIGEFLGM